MDAMNRKQNIGAKNESGQWHLAYMVGFFAASKNGGNILAGMFTIGAFKSTFGRVSSVGHLNDAISAIVDSNGMNPFVEAGMEIKSGMTDAKTTANRLNNLC